VNAPDFWNHGFMAKSVMSFEWKTPTTCAICGRPISLEDSKVTEEGKAVHGECYFEKIKKQKSDQRR
jgi:hypothetical protein